MYCCTPKKKEKEKVMTCYHLSNSNRKYSPYEYCAISQLNFVCLPSSTGFEMDFNFLSFGSKYDISFVDAASLNHFSRQIYSAGWIWVTYVIMDEHLWVTKHSVSASLAKHLSFVCIWELSVNIEIDANPSFKLLEEKNISKDFHFPVRCPQFCIYTF